MGMFDRIYDAEGNEWQTKAFGCNLDNYRIGHALASGKSDFQVEIIGGDHASAYINSYATVKDGKLSAVHRPRDKSLPLLSFGGGWYE